MHIKLGHIDYLNCVPFFHYLQECGFDGTIVKGVPAQLNGMLAHGELDVSPSSSFEYGRNFRNYCLLPSHSISAFEQVQSVLFFSAVPLDALDGEPIYLTGESATSIHLLFVILREFYGCTRIESCVPTQPVEHYLNQGKPVLLIGDRALKASLTVGPEKGVEYDLAQLWYQHTGLPFVFALWIVHRQAYQRLTKEFYQLQQQLQHSKERAFGDLRLLAESVMDRPWMSPEQLVAYWKCMSYDLNEEHIKGLKLFFELCFKYDYLEQLPELNFVGLES
nr:menaquinone biosynthesis protein [uncultured Desulfuromonas sp.]